MKKVSKIFTLSKYDTGIHHLDADMPGEPSFKESMSPIHFMIEDLYASGVNPGTKIKVTMEVVKE